jgi:hypothetical protein
MAEMFFSLVLNFEGAKIFSFFIKTKIISKDYSINSLATSFNKVILVRAEALLLRIILLTPTLRSGL